MKNTLRSLAIAALAVAATTSAFAGKTKVTKVDTPSISQVGATQASIDIQVTAGAVTGAPAGFSLQWMTAADYAANGNAWYLSEDARLCKASFSGNANLSR